MKILCRRGRVFRDMRYFVVVVVVCVFWHSSAAYKLIYSALVSCTSFTCCSAHVPLVRMTMY